MYATRQKNACRLELQLQKPVLCVAIVYTLCLVASAESLKLQPDFASYDHEQKTPSSSIVPVTCYWRDY